MRNGANTPYDVSNDEAECAEVDALQQIPRCAPEPGLEAKNIAGMYYVWSCYPQPYRRYK